MKFTKGQDVIVRDYRGELHHRRVWSETEDRVFITSDAGFEALEAGTADLFPIGFPKGDVSAIANEPKQVA